MRLIKIFLFSLCFILIFNLGTSKADTITYYFTSDHLTGGAGNPPFGKVVLTEVENNVNVEVSLYDESKFIRTGAGAYQNFLFNAKNITLSDISGTGITAVLGPLHADGTGYWDFGVYFTDQGIGGSHALPGPIEFTILNAKISDFFPNDLGYLFAADILSGQTGKTGMIDVTVPEPSLLLLLGLGLTAVGIGSRWMRRK